jgi:CDP-diacylglycerol---serine O-phosphatidyltransferase
MKQIPNLFTLLNLIFGCLAIVFILQPGLSVYTDVSETIQYLNIPEQIYLGSVFIGCAAVIDFLDGFIARLLKAESNIGKQLDSLADVVSFGVAPGFIVYQFLKLSYAQQENGLDISIIWLLPSFIIPCAGAYRLARFNIDASQSNEFKGVPIPAAGLLIASFPLIYWITYEQYAWIVPVLINKWFWYGVILIVGGLMVSRLPMMALKFKGTKLKKLMPFFILVIIAVITAFISGWIAVPVTFVSYVILSLLFKQKTT